MVCQCGGTGKGIKSKVGGELELSLQALFTYLCDLCVLKCAISPLIFNISPLIFNKLASHLHCGFDAPLANGLQIGVIPHEHPPWGNVFVCGKPFLFECHVLCCTRINNPIIRGMIISTQCRNKHLFVIFTSLINFFLFNNFLLQTISHKIIGNNLKTSKK